MSTLIEQNIASYVGGLPKSLQDFLFESDWQERLEQISAKYSLTQEQKETLLDIVTLAVIGIEEPGDIISVLVDELKVSRILAGEIVSDLKKRIFDLASEQISKAAQSTPQIDMDEPKEVSEIPELRPEIVPMVEKGEVVRVVEPPKAVVAPAGVSGNIPVAPYSAPVKQMPKPPVAPPVNLPTGDMPMPVAPHVPQSVPNQARPKSIIEEKLAGLMRMPRTPEEAKMVEQPAVAKQPLASVPRYTNDPYREPAE